ncbi:hypothetical protein [Flavitalea sp.]|nr:hypothetical protein [Flavitalea sp.]
MGRKSRNKKFTREKRINRPKVSEKWQIICLSIILVAGTLLIWSFLLVDLTFVKASIVIVPSLVFGLLIAICISRFWSRQRVGGGVLISFGILAGGAVMSFFLSATNYYFRENKIILKQLDIQSTGNRTRRKSACKTPYVVVNFGELSKEIPFPCRFEKSISLYTKLDVSLSKGFFGYYVIEEKVLVK